MTNLIDAAIARWKDSKKDIIILGAGQLGHKVKEVLHNAGIVSQMAVTREFFMGDSKDSEDVICFDDYLVSANTGGVLIIASNTIPSNVLDAIPNNQFDEICTLDFQGRYPIGKDAKITEEYLQTVSNDIEKIKSHFEDDESRKAFDEYIHQKMYSNYSKDYSSERQYFEKGIIKLGDDELFVDCGGYDGADTECFLSICKKNGTAVVFEPEEGSYHNILKRFTGDDRVRVIKAGVSNKSTELRFKSGEGSSSSIAEDGDTSIKVYSLDEISILNKVTFIKMDIEGFELAALKGAERIIKEQHPRLAICVYHKAEDIVEIPKYILSLNKDYKLYFRSYNKAATEAVLYAIQVNQ